MGESSERRKIINYPEFEDVGKFIISEKTSDYKVILEERFFNFSVNIIKYLLTLPSNSEYSVFRNQLSKSGTSIGANYEEALGAFGKKDFISKLVICLKESRESNYWLRILRELKLGDESIRKVLEQESAEFIKIFTSSIITSRSRK